MQLGYDYPKYKLARDTTGGLPIESKKFSAHTALLVKNSEYLSWAGTSSYQELFTIVDDLTVALYPSATISISSNPYLLLAANKDRSGTATIVNFISPREATPIFRNSVVEKFSQLAAEWKASRNAFDSGIAMFTNPAYQQIVGMGPEVVPLILKDLEKNLDHWFWALKAITGKDPVPPAHRGRLKLMSKDWLRWAKIQGYQW